MTSSDHKPTKEELIRQIQIFAQVGLAIVETVKEMGPLGAPAGPIYATLMSAGCSLQTFEKIMGLLVEAGRLRHSNNVYYFVK